MKTVLISTILLLFLALPVAAQLPSASPGRASTDTATTKTETAGSEIQKNLSADEYKDYQAWVALGVGGIPHTLDGYRTVKRLGTLMKDPLDVSRISSYIGKTGDLSTLSQLPKRLGNKPTIAPFAVPHRQINQHNSVEIRKQQAELFDATVASSHSTLTYKNSYLEKNSPGIFLTDPTKGNQTVIGVSHAEIGHIHAFDGSMHLILSPSDTKEVLEKGWGELHGLAGADNKAARTYMLIYSPRDQQELGVIRQILNAAVQYSSQPAQP